RRHPANGGARPAAAGVVPARPAHHVAGGGRESCRPAARAAGKLVSAMKLVKYHGLGNDFLILLDLDERERVDSERARKLCDRHRGVGADGLIRVTGGGEGSDVSMRLWNADGSEAETSGNGLRCVARAVIDAGVRSGPELVVLTAAGRKQVTVEPDG